jgi:hypothetical protein
LCLIQLTAPHALTGVRGFNGPGWDDGVYLGAAFGIVSGMCRTRTLSSCTRRGCPC